MKKIKDSPIRQIIPGQLAKTDLKHAPISDLIPYKKNANKGDVDKVALSLKEFGYVKNSVGVDEGMVLLYGHTTLKAMQKLGWDKVPEVTQVSGLTENQKKAYRLMDNQAGRSAEWDLSLLVAELNELKMDNFDLTLTGFDDKEISGFERELHKDDEPLDSEPQISRAEELRKEWGTELGQMWQCGDHRIVCGDCTDKKIIDKLVSSESVGLLLTDPPYGISVVGGGGETKFKGKVGGGGWVAPNTYHAIEGDNSTDAAKKTLLLLTDIKNKIIFGGNYFTDFLPPSRCWIVWDKENTGNFADAELAWTSFDKGVKLYRWLWNGLSRKGERSEELKGRVHPTQKPVGLFKEILKDFSEPGDIILDPFLGSGTTLISCEQTGRIFRGAEISPEYVAVILQRYKDTFKKEPVLIKE